MTKLKLCRYPNEGFGKRNNQWYLLNQFGTKYHIMHEYDKELNEMNVSVTIENGTYIGKTIEQLCDNLYTEKDLNITRW